MIEKLSIVVLTLVFLGVFLTRNLIVKVRTGQKIRSQDRLLTLAVLLTGLSIAITILSTFSLQFYRRMLPIVFLRHPSIAASGLVLFGASILMGGLISAQLKNSWRVGVHADQKTELIRTGLYAHLRNPYFLSYFLMFASLFLVRPGWVLLGVLLATVAVFHNLVLKEERFLSELHGAAYGDYKQKTGRYLPRGH